MSAPPLLAVSILFFALADLWLAFPQIDLAVAGLFWTPEGGFAARGALWEQFMYGSIDEALVIVGLGLIGAWAIGRWHASAASSALSGIDAPEAKAMRVVLTRRGDLRLAKPSKVSAARLVSGRQLGFLLLLLALVPGLVVNQVFKEHWGRARPIQLEQFGGHQTFTPAFVVSDQNGGSFSSGHVAAAAWLVAVPVVLFGVSSIWTGAALLYLLAMVLARMAAGAHFLSDTLTSILLVWLGFLILQRLFSLEPPGTSILGSHPDSSSDSDSDSGAVSDRNARAEPLLQRQAKAPAKQARR
ncbi:phosphatase PAP2 family protein [Lamprobacter modestohalophilus]|uniref:phosphatase PAP2 family protein n=1 Tax=Lamprobacter modestohalophilus TaxID=1064514 RepID=UPI002ADEF9B0|nr:phosphatase PAP2 family protein [Lamprobacter modestohalophilus]MEA1048880.1 phosphatase PAP2 family protein [Lamprobacter modestohalophilus]